MIWNYAQDTTWNWYGKQIVAEFVGIKITQN